jgi:hypothetical protein
VAGTFYPAQAAQCREAVSQLMTAARQSAGDASRLGESAGIGAIIPHAGWICSGAIAAEGIAALANRRPQVDVVVVFGAIHTPVAVEPSVLDSYGRWAAPGGETSVTTQLREQLAAGKGFVIDDRFHLHEHAVEVELPLIQSAWPGGKILPIEVPPNPRAVEVGRSAARAVAAAGLSAVYLASSDLTHYGPNYRFTPAGIGPIALQWAMENDRRLLRVVTDMRPENVVPEVLSHGNACGGGAIAAMMAACLEHGGKKAVVLKHTNSYQTLASVAPQPPDNAVGYAAVWIG